MKHYLVYQITNLINEKIYVGIHITENVEDGYMGSGTALKKAYKKYGLDNFKREILFDFDNPEEMVAKESELVDRKFIARKDVYNISLGGSLATVDSIVVRDKEGNCFRVHKTDERWISGVVIPVAKGLTVVRDLDGKPLSISNTDDRFLSGELSHITKNKVTVRDKDGRTFQTSKHDVNYLNKTLSHVTKDRVTVKSKDGLTFQVNKNDPRFISGELTHIWDGKRHNEFSKNKIGEANSLHQTGSGNSQYGTCWIRNEFENKKIKKTELESYLKKGWIKGRKIKIIK